MRYYFIYWIFILGVLYSLVDSCLYPFSYKFCEEITQIPSHNVSVGKLHRPKDPQETEVLIASR